MSDGCALQAFPLRGRWHFCPIRAKMTDEVSSKNSVVIAITPHQSPTGDSFPSRGSLSGEHSSPINTPSIKPLNNNFPVYIKHNERESRAQGAACYNIVR